MSRQNRVIQVFVASPSDVAEEREALETVIVQLNQIWSQTLGLTFELVKWDTSVRPTFGSDPQSEINKQIGLEYDVFIGIFWGRLGTETPRAASGTIEEFDRAYARLDSTDNAPEIMLYFKDAPIAPSKLDPKQLQGVQDFKRSLPSKGGLYADFEDLAGFESSLRAHLSAIAQAFSKSKLIPPSAPLEPTVGIVVADPSDDSDYGYFDYIDIYGTKIAEMTTAIDVINEATVRIGEQLSQRSVELQSNTHPDAKAALRFVNRAADDMNSYAKTMSVQTSALSAARIATFTALSNALALRGDFSGGEEDLSDLRNTLASMSANIHTAQAGMAGMRAAAEGLPRISKDLNRAKRAVVSQLDAFLFEIESTESTVNNIVDAIDRMLPNEP